MKNKDFILKLSDLIVKAQQDEYSTDSFKAELSDLLDAYNHGSKDVEDIGK